MDSFLTEDAARRRAAQGVVPPRLRELERAVSARFDPPYAHVDISNRLQLLGKEFIARLGRPPRLRELSRAEDPTRESNDEKLKRAEHEPLFLGRFAEVFVRQAAGGEILEILVRTSSGFRSFDDDAVDAVLEAVRRSPPHAEGFAAGVREVRSLWRLEATAYVVYSVTPVGQFDEATGRMELHYPLQKRVDHKVKLVAVY